MEFIIDVCRFALPVLTLIILVKCFLTLLIGHPVNENYAFIEDISTGEKIALNTWETSIGKSKTCDIMLSHDVISRFHAVICRRVDGWYIFDTLSKNGTYVKKGPSYKTEEVGVGGTTIENGNIICFSNKQYRFNVANDPVILAGKRKKGKDAVGKADVAIPGYANAAYQAQTPAVGNASGAKKQAAIISRKRGTIYLLVENVITIGSNSANDIKISNPTVSRFHAVMVKNNGYWYITDKNSTNGTTVNGQRITGTRLLRNNDIVGISEEKFVFTNDYR